MSESSWGILRTFLYITTVGRQKCRHARTGDTDELGSSPECLSIHYTSCLDDIGGTPVQTFRRK